MFTANQKVVITSKVGTHVAEGEVGTVIDGPGSFMGTYNVEVGGRAYGFLPTELIPLTERLEYLRGEINAERISTGELIELQGYADHIDRSDVQLLEWAGVPEFEEDEDACVCSAQDEAGCASHAGYPCSQGQ